MQYFDGTLHILVKIGSLKNIIDNKNAFRPEANRPIALTLTLVLKLDLDMVLIYHCAKKKVSIPPASKVTCLNGITNRHDKNITSPRTQPVIKCNILMKLILY